MVERPNVLVIGIDPDLIDFAHAEGVPPGTTAEGIRGKLEADKERLDGLGYDALLCLVDLGDTAEHVVVERLNERRFDCVVIAAGIRTIPGHFELFEKLINIVHRDAPAAKIAFNTQPDDTAEAVQRWI